MALFPTIPKHAYNHPAHRKISINKMFRNSGIGYVYVSLLPIRLDDIKAL